MTSLLDSFQHFYTRSLRFSDFWDHEPSRNIIFQITSLREIFTFEIWSAIHIFYRFCNAPWNCFVVERCSKSYEFNFMYGVFSGLKFSRSRVFEFFGKIIFLELFGQRFLRTVLHHLETPNLLKLAFLWADTVPPKKYTQFFTSSSRFYEFNFTYARLLGFMILEITSCRDSSKIYTFRIFLLAVLHTVIRHLEIPTLLKLAYFPSGFSTSKVY